MLTRPRTRLSARRTSRWPANRCTHTPDLLDSEPVINRTDRDEERRKPMSTPVNLPALGESVTEGTITRWLKQVGDSVEVDEPLLEVSTDKVDTEIPSPVAGTLLSITADEDETVEVGAELAIVGDPSESGGDESDSGGDQSDSGG